jgi:hypothetical protein
MFNFLFGPFNIVSWACCAVMNAVIIFSLIVFTDWVFRAKHVSVAERYFAVCFGIFISLCGPIGSVCIIVWVLCCGFLFGTLTLLEGLARIPGLLWLDRKMVQLSKRTKLDR